MQTAEKREVGLIVLAAGASSRMKQPKQLVEFENRTLLRRSVETALATDFDPVIVVLGANYEKSKAQIEDLNAIICLNKNFSDGLSSSIKAGLQKLLQIKPKISAVLFTLADQPFVTAENLNEFFERNLLYPNSIIAAEYNKKVGVPALFTKQSFDRLLNLEGDQGARDILRGQQQKIIEISLPEAEFDIDTPDDFMKLTMMYH